MFSIYLLDSSKLFQWDLNRKIKIIGKEEVDEVHFSHVGDEEALVVKPIKENNILIANIPNILLQESKDIFVYLVSKDKTLKETFFTVGRREKPTDYLYTEIDVLNYSSLEKRLAELEEKLNNIPVEETDPTVPDWAKQPNKPRYTAAEVGALSSTETVRQLAQKQDKSNLVTSINESSVDSTYPSTRAVYEYVGEEFARLIGSAPDALDTIEELAAAFNNNPDILDILNTSITNKQEKTDSVGVKTTQGGEIFNDYTNNIAFGIHSHAEGQNNKARGRFSHAEGLDTEAKADVAHTEGEATISYTVGSHAEGKSTMAGGNGTETGGSYAHAEGVSTIALARGSHAEGDSTLAQAQYSHAEGGSCQATGEYSHAEGCNNGNIMTTASGKGSHAEGIGNWAIGKGSHAEGINNSASRDYSHAEGDSTTASGIASHAEGKGTIANSSFQHVQGKYNVEDATNKYAHIVGNGEDVNNRSNAHTIDWEGNAEYQGDVLANACNGENPISLIDTANALNDKITTPSQSTIGQFLVVKEVDENGAPLKWETVDEPAQDLSNFVTDNELSNTLSSYVKKNQYATSVAAGIVKTSNTYGVSTSGSNLQVYKASSTDIESKTHNYRPIVPSTLDIAVKAGLANSKITWSETEKQKARKLIGAISASDIPEIEPQVQADYGETNSFSASYIKNKTHYDTRRLVEINEQINYGGNAAYGNITSDLYDLFINKTVDGLLVDGKTISYASEYINNKYGYLIYDLSDNRQLIVNAYSTSAYVRDNSSPDGSTSGKLTVTGSINTGSFKQLDEKFIPDSIARTEQVRQLSEEMSDLKENAPTVEDVLNALPTWQGGAY